MKKLWNETLYKQLERIRGELDNYIKEKYRGEKSCSIGSAAAEEPVRYCAEAELRPMAFALPEVSRKSAGRAEIDRFLERKEETFSTMLLRLIDEKGLKDSEVYKQANIDRRLFSKIRGDEDYVPSKKTAIAFCLALQLTMEEADELLQAAGYTLSASSEFDLIIMYLIEHKEYNVLFANIVLDEYGLGTLSR